MNRHDKLKEGVVSAGIGKGQEGGSTSLATRTRNLPLHILNKILGCNQINTFLQLPCGARTLVLFILFMAFYLSYVMLSELHTMTYVWQMTDLGDMITPVQRKTCDLMSTSSPVDSTGSGLTQFIGKPGQRGPSIAMVYVYAESDASSLWTEELYTRILNNRRKYCDKHGYTMINANKFIDTSRPVAWSKVLAVKNYLPSYDYVMYIDMDIVIMNMDVKLESFINSSPKNKDFIMTEDWNGPNTGVWFAKNSPWSIWFLDEVWKQKQLVAKRSSTGIAHPFEYEQRAFHYILQTDVWRKRGLPIYDGDAKKIGKHFYYLPQCSFNSYSLHPFDMRGDREKRHYVDGDFLIHFAGQKGQKKVDLLNHYLDVAEHGYNSRETSELTIGSSSSKNNRYLRM